MQLSITDIPGGAAGRNLTTAVAGSGGQFYREVVLLDFKTGGQPDRIVVDRDKTAFSATFLSQDHNLVAAKSPISATLEQTPALVQAVRAKLERPLKIARVATRSRGGGPYFAAEHTPGRGAETIAGISAGAQATKEWEIGAVEYAGERWEMGSALKTAGDIRFYRMDGDAVAPEATTSAPIGSELETEFISADFAVRLVNAGGNPMALAPEDLAAVVVRCSPTGPRIGLAAPGSGFDDTGDIRFFWQLPGEIRDSAPNLDADGEGGERLADALQVLLDEHLTALREEAQKKGTPAVIPDRLQVPLVMESDVPCRVKLNTLAVQYHLTRQTLCTEESSAPSGEKIRLRFPGGKTVTRHVTVSLPAGALVKGVTLRVAPAFGANPAVALNAGSAQGQAPEEAYGIALSTERRAAVQFTPATPLTVTGLGLPLLAHAVGTELRVALQEDWDGAPSGNVLAAAQLTIDEAGGMGYYRVDFGLRLALFPQPYWIVVATAKGAGVWLGRPEAEGRALLLPPAANGGGLLPSALTGIQPGHRFFAPAHDMAPESPPFDLELNGATVAASSMSEDTFTFKDGALEDYLNSALAGSTAPAPTEDHQIALSLSSSQAGGLTVYPIEIRYAWPGE